MDNAADPMAGKGKAGKGRKRRQLAILGAGAAAVAGFALWKSKASGTGSAATTAGGSATDAGTATPYTYSGGGYGGSDDSDIEAGLEGISEQLAAFTAGNNPANNTQISDLQNEVKNQKNYVARDKKTINRLNSKLKAKTKTKTTAKKAPKAKTTKRTSGPVHAGSAAKLAVPRGRATARKR
jgi:hypothetical protein